MRLVILNPHGYLLGKQMFQRVFDYHQLNTYSYIVEEYAREKPNELVFLADGTGSSFAQTSYYKRWQPRLPLLFMIFSYVEFFAWFIINGINPFRHALYFRIAKLDPRMDVILIFPFVNRNRSLWRYSGLIAAHLTHYHHDTEAIAAYLKGLQRPLFLAEADLTKNAYFRHYFPWVKKVCILPFIFTNRFKNTKPFRERSSQCFAGGSMSIPSGASYVRYYGADAALQPMRKLIYDNQDTLRDIMDIYMYPHTDALKDLKIVYPNDSFFAKWMKRHLPASVLKKFFKYQLPYFRFNIVEKYNDCQMFLSPEERTGLPSIKIFEGVRCGSALLGIDHSMYADIGFKNGITYVAYRENDPEDLRQKIHYYQTHPEQLEVIAETGYEFVSEHFSAHAIVRGLWADLERAHIEIANP